MRAVIACVAVMAVLFAGPAMAQDPEKRVDFNFGSGATISTGELNNHLGSGYNINFGMTVNVTPVFGIHAEYSFNGLGQKQVQLPVVPQPVGSGIDQPFYADMNMQYGTFNAVVKPKFESKIHPYFTGGLGIYYRPVKVTTPSVGYVPGYCDPFWYYCSPGGYVPVDAIVGERTSTDFGINLGGGVNFRVAESASLYFEIRYHYIWGPKFTTNSTTYDSNSAFVPITFGVRF